MRLSPFRAELGFRRVEDSSSSCPHRANAKSLGLIRTPKGAPRYQKSTNQSAEEGSKETAYRYDTEYLRLRFADKNSGGHTKADKYPQQGCRQSGEPADEQDLRDPALIPRHYVFSNSSLRKKI
jgi:hypothetical protein